MKVLVAQSCPTLCDSMNLARQSPLSMGFSKQEYWSGLSFPSPGDPPKPGIESASPAFQADSLPSETHGKLKLIAASLQYIKVPKVSLFVISRATGSKSPKCVFLGEGDRQENTD